MIPLHRLFYLGCLAIAPLLTSFAKAQALSESKTSHASSSPGGWLGRDEPKTVAWRAHNAMLIGDESAIPNLVSLASRWQPLVPQPVSDDSAARDFTMKQKEERDAMSVVLDALIQLNAPVPADTLRNLAPDFGNAVAVILAHMPAGESAPLSQEFFRSAKAGGTLQYVSAALLALHPPPGFAGKLLGDTRVQARVVAVAPGVGIGFGTSQGSCGQFSVPEREDWPEMGQYRLSTQMSEGVSVLVTGNEPIYVSREEFTHYVGNECGWALYFGREQRRALIAEMLGVPAEQIPWETDPTEVIEFISLGQFTGELLAFIEEQQLMYLDTAKALQAQGLLAASELSQSLPLIQLDLIDERRLGSRDEDSDDENANDKVETDLEPISKDAIKLPARVVWTQWPF